MSLAARLLMLLMLIYRRILIFAMLVLCRVRRVAINLSLHPLPLSPLPLHLLLSASSSHLEDRLLALNPGIQCALVLRASHLELLLAPNQTISVELLAHSCSKLHLSGQAENLKVHRNLKSLGDL